MGSNISGAIWDFRKVKVLNAAGTVINPAQEDGNLQTIASKISKLGFELNKKDLGEFLLNTNDETVQELLFRILVHLLKFDKLSSIYTNLQIKDDMGEYQPIGWSNDTQRMPVTTRDELEEIAPTFATVGVTSSTVLNANSSRKGCVIVNTSANTISLGIDRFPAMLYSGITLMPSGGTWTMDEYTFTMDGITAIASAAGSNIAIQEFI